MQEILSRISGEAKKLPLNVRWVRTENIHLTIVFMGDMDEGLLPQVQETARSVCGGNHPFELSLQGLGFFGTLRNPRVLWAGLYTDLKRMARFRDDLQKGLAPLGVKKETRPFRPHLTLGRFKAGAGSAEQLQGLVTQYKELASPAETLSELALFRSDLRKDGAVYTKLSEWSLGQP